MRLSQLSQMSQMSQMSHFAVFHRCGDNSVAQGNRSGGCIMLKKGNPEGIGIRDHRRYSGAGGRANRGIGQKIGGQRLPEAAPNDVPRCVRKLGTLSIVNGADVSDWTRTASRRLKNCCAPVCCGKWPTKTTMSTGC
jgi:hypothetical protein